MSAIPTYISGYGENSLTPRQNPAFVPGADFGTEEYYVWSRCDGLSSLKEIILMLGLGSEKSLSILRSLRERGAVLLPGETSVPIKEIKPKKVKAKKVKTATVPQKEAKGGAAKAKAEEAVEDEDWSEKEQAALALDVEMTEQEKKKVLRFCRTMKDSTHFELLGVDVEADKRTIKRAYFSLSKDFHPDRFYGKELGVFGAWLAEAFKAITGAFKVLGDKKKKAKYKASLCGDSVQQQGQTKTEHANSLYEDACEYELQGQYAQALKRFAACTHLDPVPKYLRRAAMCAVQAGELSIAEEYAKNAVGLQSRNPSYLRVLADVYSAGHRPHEAKTVLVEALGLYTENDALLGELQSDLAKVNALLGT